MSSVREPPTLVEAIVPFADLSNEPTATGGIVITVATTVLDSTVSSVPTGTSVPVTDLLVSSTTSVVAAVTPRTTIAPAPATTVAPTSATTVPPTSVQSVYNITGAGIITLKQDATSLKLVSVNPNSGWTFTAENKYPNRVEVEFKNGNKSVKFRAELLNGRVIAAVSVGDEFDGDDATKDAKAAAKIASDAAEKSAKASYDATERAAKVTFDVAEKSAKATYDATERAAKEAFEAAEKAAKEKSDDAALRAAQDTYEATLRTAKETFEATLRTAKETFEAALRKAKEALEASDD